MKEQIKFKYVYDRRKKASETTPGTIEICIIVGQKRSYLSTKVSVFPFQWKNEKIVMHPEADSRYPD